MTAALSSLRFVDLLASFRSPTPTPGGGSASALAGAVGASLLAMVAALPKPRARTADDEKRLAAESADDFGGGGDESDGAHDDLGERPGVSRLVLGAVSDWCWISWCCHNSLNSSTGRLTPGRSPRADTGPGRFGSVICKKHCFEDEP